MAKPVGLIVGGALNYNAFNYVPEALSPQLPASSSPNVIATGTIGQALRGQPISAPNSTSAFPNLQYVRYACVVASQAQVNVAQTCTSQLSGDEYDTGATVVQELVFNPVVGINQFASSSFPTFTRLKQVK